MNDLISRQVAIEALKNVENHAFNSFYDGLIKAYRIIADLPSADPEREGKWIEDGYYEHPCVCSYCGKEGKREWKYCPNCGARMKDETREG